MAFGVGVLWVNPARAADPEPAIAPDSAPLAPPAQRRVAAVASVLPGVLAHGAGHWVLGRRQTATRLVAAEGVGLGMFLGAGLAIYFTGASRYWVGPTSGMAILGAGLFVSSWWADVYGALGLRAVAGPPLRRAPWVESELGYQYVYDPKLPYRHFSVERITLRRGRFQLTPTAWLSPDKGHARYRVSGAVRLFGSGLTPGLVHDGSYVDVQLGVTHARFPSEGFTTWTAELGVAARLHLAEVGPTLRGAFAQSSLGYAARHVQYTALRAPADGENLLLGGFGFGMYLPAHPGSEALLYYEHRHDDVAAGLTVPGLGSGVLGHFGTRATWYWMPRWGVTAHGEIGGAGLFGLGLLFREGAS